MAEKRRLTENQRGIISLEACISVLSFLILMLLLAGLFRMFMAQNLTAHAALESAQSLALDAYSGKKIGNGSWESTGSLLNGVFDRINNDDFSSYDDWFSENADVSVENAVEKRFIGFLAGGDRTKADQLLKRLNVKEGIEGVDFSFSKTENGMLYVEIRYQLEYDFQIGGLGTVEVKQKACAKLWQ